MVTPSPVPTGDASISGQVLDDSGNPVSGATVSLYLVDSKKGDSEVTKVSNTTTDENGNYEIDGIASGHTYKLTFTKTGYKTPCPTVELTDDTPHLYMRMTMPMGSGTVEFEIKSLPHLKQPDIHEMTGDASLSWDKTSNEGFQEYVVCRSENEDVKPDDEKVCEETSEDTTDARDCDKVPMQKKYYYRLFEKIEVEGLGDIYLGSNEWSALFKRYEWQKCLGGSNDDKGNTIVENDDGTVMVGGGSSSDDGDVTNNNGGEDCWFCKVSDKEDDKGCMGGSGNDSMNSMIKSGDGSYVCVGPTDSNDGMVSGCHGGKDFWMVKFASDGTRSWALAMGGSADDVPYKVIEKAAGGYFAAGCSESNDGDVGSNAGGKDVWMVNVDDNGNLIGGRAIGGSNNDVAYSVKELPDGG